MKVYGFRSWTRDNRVRWALDELGIPFEVVTVNAFAGEHKRPEYLALHPGGKLPVLVDGDLTLFESGAIVNYLAETYGADKIIPPMGSKDRALYHQWVFFATTSLEDPCVRLFVNACLFADRPGAQDRLKEALDDFADFAPVLEANLVNRQWAVGERFTGADILLGCDLFYANKANALAKYPALTAYFERLKARPAFQKTFSWNDLYR